MAYIKLNLANYIHNLEIITKKLINKNLLMVVLKDNAYGHGLIEIASLASNYGLTQAVVKTYQEALKIESFFENILILNPNNITNINSNFSLTINSIENLYQVPKLAKIELKIDTGMHRNGILFDELTKALEIINQKGLNFFGFFTHFRSSDELSSELFWQIEKWEEAKDVVKKFCKEKNLPLPRFHSKNSAAVLRCNEMIDEYVRCGIATYGYVELNDIFGNFNLKPVLSLYAKKISSRVLHKGQKIGYGGVYKTNEDKIISTYDIGYSDGLYRCNPKRKLKIKDGHILGKISMDYISCDSCKDEICIFDDVNDFKKHFNTISYDILVKLSHNLTKIIF